MQQSLHLTSDIIDWVKEYSKNKKVYVEDLFLGPFNSFFTTLSKNINCLNPRQLLWHVLNNNCDIIRCQCGTPVKWFRNGNCYRNTCSPTCAGKKSRKLKKESKKSSTPWYQDPVKLAAAIEKRRQRCFEKYGVTSHQQRPDVRKKTAETNIKKYGYSVPTGNSTIMAKAAATFKERFTKDSDNHKKLIDKRKKTSLTKYGVEFPMQNDEIKNRQHDSMQTRYGVKHALLDETLNNKRKITNLEKFGVEEAIASDAVKQKIIKAFKEKYGENNWIQANYSELAKSILFDQDKFKSELSGMTLDQAKDYLKVSLRTILNYSQKYNLRDIFIQVKITNDEQQIKDLLDSLINTDLYIQNSKSIIPPYELDFFIPSKNLAIEINGLYWHSELGGGQRNRSYHITKWKKCRENNITLLMFNSCDLKEKFHLVESKIKRHLQIPSPVVGARKLKIELCSDYSIEENFLNVWHLQGPSSNRNICFVAKYQDKIVGISTWKYKNSHAELVRFATDVNYSYPGLLSKMIKEFIRVTGFVGTIISYSNNQYGDGKAYISSGFQFNEITPPGYSYTNNYIKLESRIKFQKHKLAKIFDLDEQTISGLSEWEIMKEHGYDRIWDCGHTRWVFQSK